MDAVSKYSTTDHHTGRVSQTVSGGSAESPDSLQRLTGGRSSPSRLEDYPEITHGRTSGKRSETESILTSNLSNYMGVPPDTGEGDTTNQTGTSVASSNQRGTPVSLPPQSFIPPPPAQTLPGSPPSGESGTPPSSGSSVSPPSSTALRGSNLPAVTGSSPSSSGSSAGPGVSTITTPSSGGTSASTAGSSARGSGQSSSTPASGNERTTPSAPSSASSDSPSTAGSQTGGTTGTGEGPSIRRQESSGRSPGRPSAAPSATETSDSSSRETSSRRRPGRPPRRPGSSSDTVTAEASSGAVREGSARRPGRPAGRSVTSPGSSAAETSETFSGGTPSARRPGRPAGRSVTSPGSSAAETSESSSGGTPSARRPVSPPLETGSETSGTASSAGETSGRSSASGIRRPAGASGTSPASQDRGEVNETGRGGEDRLRTPTRGARPLPYHPDTGPNYSRSWNGREVLQNLAQDDDTDRTRTDAVRCGSASALAPHILNGPGAVSRVTERVEVSGLVDPEHPPEGDTRSVDEIRTANEQLVQNHRLRNGWTRNEDGEMVSPEGDQVGDRRTSTQMIRDNRELGEIRQRVNNGEATYGDMSRLQDIMYRSSGGRDVSTVEEGGGLTPEQVTDMSERASGSTRRGWGEHSADATRESLRQLPRERSYVMYIDNSQAGSDYDDRHNRRDHFVTVGRDREGNLYVYDPAEEPGRNMIYENRDRQRFGEYFSGQRMPRLTGTSVPTHD